MGKDRKTGDVVVHCQVMVTLNEKSVDAQSHIHTKLQSIK